MVGKLASLMDCKWVALKDYSRADSSVSMLVSCMVDLKEITMAVHSDQLLVCLLVVAMAELTVVVKAFRKGVS